MPMLLTGGTGGLGIMVAGWFAACGHGQLTLLSRRGTIAVGAEHLYKAVSSCTSRYGLTCAMRQTMVELHAQ